MDFQYLVYHGWNPKVHFVTELVWIQVLCHIILISLFFFPTENKSNNFIPLEPNSRLFLYGNGSIEIKNAERQHEGFYTCQADNGIGTPISKTVFIKVNSE